MSPQLASERLDAHAGRWQPVEEGMFVEVSRSGLERLVLLEDSLGVAV